jgi:hypothetical protein
MYVNAIMGLGPNPPQKIDEQVKYLHVELGWVKFITLSDLSLVGICRDEIFARDARFGAYMYLMP